jgi:hypothetical protein
MSRLAWVCTFAALTISSAIAETAVPDLRGTWTGQSESIIMGRGNPHHGTNNVAEPRMSSVPFTLTIDKQDGRRFSGIWSSPKSKENVIAVISRNNTIYLLDTDGFTVGTILAPNKIELCYMQQGQAVHVASCTEMTKQP